MYLDLIVLLIIVIIGLVKYKNFSSYVHLFCFSDILFRVLTFINNKLKLEDISAFISKYIPTSIEGVIMDYTSDTIELVLIWLYVIIYICFLYYILQGLLKRK